MRRPAVPARATGRAAPPPPGARAGTDAAVALVLWVAATALNLWLVRATVATGILTGEEASVSVAYVVALPEHEEISVYATNFGAHAVYWAASHLVPDLDIFSGRWVKAPFLALLAPLAHLVLRRRIGVGVGPAVVGALTVVALPGVALFGWMATENGMEAVWGLTALALVTAPHRAWPGGLVLAGAAMSTYSTGLTWAAVVVVVALVRVVRTRSARDAGGVVLAAAGGAGIVLFPVWWWTNGPVLLTGGGAFAPSPARLVEAARLIGVDGASYYFFDDAAAWVGPALAVPLAVAVVAAVALRPAVLAPYALLAVASLVLYALAGNITGTRRLVALTVVGGLAVGVVTDAVASAARRRRVPRSVAGVLVPVLVGAAVLVPAGAALAGWTERLADGRQTLPADFALVLDPGATMPQTLARIREDLATGRLTADDVARRDEAVRTFAMLRLVADRTGTAAPGVPTPAEIVTLYRRSPKCFGDDCLPGDPGRP